MRDKYNLYEYEGTLLIIWLVGFLAVMIAASIYEGYVSSKYGEDIKIDNILPAMAIGAFWPALGAIFLMMWVGNLLLKKVGKIGSIIYQLKNRSANPSEKMLESSNASYRSCKECENCHQIIVE